MNDNNKQLVATSKATYRNVTIMATRIGFTFIWNGKQFDCLTLGEATANIDAIYAQLARVILTSGSQE